MIALDGITKDVRALQYSLAIAFFFLTGEQEIKALKVKCSNGENGCSWMGELQSLENHLTTCEYALLRCTNTGSFAANAAKLRERKGR